MDCYRVGGLIQYKTSILFVVWFIIQFTIGGLIGIVSKNYGLDIALYGTYVLAHFHYVLSLGAIFALLRRFQYWMGNIFGRICSKTLGQIHFCTTFFRVNLTSFFHEFYRAFEYATSISDYPNAYIKWNALSSFGSYTLVVGIHRLSHLKLDLVNPIHNANVTYTTIPTSSQRIQAQILKELLCYMLLAHYTTNNNF